MAYTDYSQAFQGAEQKYGLPPGTLGGIGYVESRYNPKAVSPKGAQGLMQFMPTTAKNLGLSNPFDPNASIDAAGNLMHQNMQATHGNLQNALMMYNGGTDPSKWQQSYASQVQAHMQPPQQPYYNPQPGGQQMPPQMPPQGNPYQQGQAPVSLAGLAQPLPSAPQGGPQTASDGFARSMGDLARSLPGNIPTKKPSKFNVGNVLGVLGDALSAYGGRQPTFGPMLNQEHMMEQQQGFEREKFNQELQMRMYAMTHPEEMMKAEAFQAAPQPVRQSMVDYENTMHPNVVGVQQQNGSYVNQVQPRQLSYQPGDVHPGTDGNYKFLGGDPTNQASWEKVQ